MKAASLFIRLLVFIVAVAFFLLPGGARADTGTIILPGSIPADIREGYLTPTDTYPPGKMIHIKIHLTDLGDDEGKRFDTIVDWLKNNGMKVGPLPQDHRTIEADTSVQTAEALFQISIDQYLVHSMLYYANSQPPAIPVVLNGIVTSIEGLDNFPPQGD